ncbi:hypothetical protein SEA_MEDIUMFRY_35 [Arthrobacter phage MediumFry]|nr:hypothetical protein SEA_MEDIUMFRY_35 [Arthrobacter phage MediumFry]
MSDKKKVNKVKQFITNHPEAIVYGAATAVIGSMYAYAVISATKASKAAIKAHNEYADAVNSLVERAASEGKETFMLADWTYLLVPKETPVEWIRID